MSMADGKDESSNTIQRDGILFFDCDLVVLQAERTLFRVPRKTLTHQSQVLKDLIGQKDSSEEKPIVLPEVTADEFRCFFKVAYSTQKNNVCWPESIKMPDEAKEWIAVLKLSTRWKCLDLRQLAIKSMNQLEAFRCLDPVRKVIVGRDLHVQMWVMDGYRALATREESISDEEMQMIGAVEAFRLERMRNLRSKNNRYSDSNVSEEISREFHEEFSSITNNERKYLVQLQVILSSNVLQDWRNTRNGRFRT